MSAHTTEELDAAAARRSETSDLIVNSEAPWKLVVAGPGTGKTHNFRRVLEAVGGGGLALTFIRALVADLERDLGDLAQVNTFHGYCKHLAHSLALDGLTNRFDYYPQLLHLVAEDLALLGQADVNERSLEYAFHQLADNDLIAATLGITSYYDAMSHCDAVYRVLVHLEANPAAIPAFPIVVVDEYQDFCLLETRFIDVLKSKSPVLVAGDDDQALYGFKGASAEFIRALAADGDFARFDLPFCSRCTEVVVNAVNNVVIAAQKRGNLSGRIEREYLCYLPDKLEDSEAHPALIWAACSTHTKKAPYVGRYVTEQIERIAPEDIAESHEKGYPTALVVGRRHHVSAAYEVIVERFPSAVFRTSEPLSVTALQAYRRLARDPASSLAWRILLYVDPLRGADDLIREAIGDRRPLADLLPDDYKGRHIAIAELVRSILDGTGVNDEQAAAVSAATRMSLADVQRELGVDEDDYDPPATDAEDGVPSIICTTLLGAKGLSAGHVFVVGFNDGAFPKDPAAVTDDEVCKLIVALSRTRKKCHLVSCGMFGGPPFQEPSSFLGWFGVPIETVKVSKEYWS